MISLAITSYNRSDLTIESFKEVHDDPMIAEVVIVDDCSHEHHYEHLQNLTKDYEKVKLFRNGVNMGMALNKAEAIKKCESEWVIIFDSDNILTKKYLDYIPYGLNPNTIYCPSFAEPNFDYREFSNRLINKEYAKIIINQSNGEPLFNTCNYLVHRDTYLEVFEIDKGIKATDTIQFAHKWLKADNYFYVVAGMRYFHRVHDGSGFLADANYNMKKAQEYKQKILAL